MPSIGFYFLLALTACTIWQGSLAEPNETKEKLDRLEVKIEAVQAKVEETQARLEGSLVAKLNVQQAALTTIENQLEAVLLKMEVPRQPIPPGFEKIGTRYFRIVNELASWEPARRSCRQLGGYLAAFRNEEEMTAIIPKLGTRFPYFLGLNDQDTEGHFVSVASQKPALFVQWHDRYPNHKNQTNNCVLLDRTDEEWHEKTGLYMRDGICKKIGYFICQADNET